MNKFSKKRLYSFRKRALFELPINFLIISISTMLFPIFLFFLNGAHIFKTIQSKKKIKEKDSKADKTLCERMYLTRAGLRRV